MIASKELTKLTCLKIHVKGSYQHTAVGFAIPITSHALQLQGLKSLHLTCFKVIDLRLDCPGLRSLTLHFCTFPDLMLNCFGLRSLILKYCDFQGNLSLQAPLEHTFCKGDVRFCRHEAFPRSNIYGLMQLKCHLWCMRTPNELLGVLHCMSRLRTLDLIIRKDDLPLWLPAGLQAITYITSETGDWDPRCVQHFVSACQLPELQSLTLVDWKPCLQNVLMLLKKVAEERGVKIIHEWGRVSCSIDE